MNGEKRKHKINFIAPGLILAGVIFLMAGIWRGEAYTVFMKAVNICLECIGVG
ncbi:MAG: CD1871A family CXXC motif-containing protein [Bacillota bacterium]|nr:CD1871A family CXXC motif-containing protein [Bacillota bacterium]